MITIKCPFCGFVDSKVLDTRTADEGSSIRRRRECNSCKKRFTTYEKLENLPLIVVKKDSSREVFDPSKILNGLIKACEKRPVSFRDLERVTYSIEKKLKNEMDREVTSTYIGELIMEELKNIDEVAYVRFASVYREFRDVNTFIQEIEDLLKKNY